MTARERAPSGIISRIISAIREHLAYRATIRDLHRMSDARLADLGLERHRIPEVVNDLMAMNAAKREDWRDGRDHAQQSVGTFGAPGNESKETCQLKASGGLLSKRKHG